MYCCRKATNLKVEDSVRLIVSSYGPADGTAKLGPSCALTTFIKKIHFFIQCESFHASKLYIEPLFLHFSQPYSSEDVIWSRPAIWSAFLKRFSFCDAACHISQVLCFRARGPCIDGMIMSNWLEAKIPVYCIETILNYDLQSRGVIYPHSSDGTKIWADALPVTQTRHCWDVVSLSFLCCPIWRCHTTHRLHGSAKDENDSSDHRETSPQNVVSATYIYNLMQLNNPSCTGLHVQKLCNNICSPPLFPSHFPTNAHRACAACQFSFTSHPLPGLVLCQNST